MPIRVVCQSCGRQLNAPDKLAGRKAKCPNCHTILPIPAVVPQKVAPPVVKERNLPKRREPEPEQRITHLEEVPDEPPQRIKRKAKASDEAEPAEEVVAAKPKKPKRKKRRRSRERAEQTIPTWLLWLISLGGFALVAGLIALPAIYKGYGFLVLLYAVIMVVMMPVSTVILIASMFISSALGGGIDFGEARTTIPKAVGLLLVVNSICLLPFSRYIAAPIWWGGLMFLFGLEWWETRILVAVNWGLNFMAQMAVFAVLTTAFMHGASHLDSIAPRGQQLPTTAEEKAIEAIEELGGECITDDEDDDSPVVSVSLRGKKATDADLARLKSFPKLRSLDLTATQITDAGLDHLKKLNQLQTLTLTGTKVTDAGVADLQTALPRVRIVR